MNLTKRKAEAIFEEYKKAELAGSDSQAELLESQLKSGGWKVTYGPDGWTIVKIESDGILNQLMGQQPTYLPRNTPISPYNGNSPNIGAGVYVIIGLGVLTLIVAIILIVRAYKKNKNAGLTRLQTAG